MHNASPGIGANTQAKAAHEKRQREAIVEDDDNDEVEVVDLKTCKPKTGRSMIWTENLFVLDALKRPVCTCCGIVVPIGNGVPTNSTVSLFRHYESPKANEAHRKAFQEARKRHKGKGTNLRGQKNLVELVDLSTCTPKSAGRSMIWTEKLFVIDALKRPVCTCCGMVVSAGNGVSSNTTNLFNHYESPKVDEAHQATMKEARAKYALYEGDLKANNKGKVASPSRSPQHSGGAVKSRTPLSNRVSDDLLNWVILAQQPLQGPEHPALRKAFQTATGNPSFDVGGRVKYRAALMAKKAKATATLKEMLEGTTPAVTTGMWTSDSNGGFISITVHFIQTSGSAWVLKKGTAACEGFDGSHTGARVGATVMSILKRLGIDDSVVCVTSDTASTMKHAIEKHTPDSIAWLGCAAHKMECSVQKYVSSPGLKATLAIFIRVAAHVHKSPQSQQAFEAAQRVRFKHKTPTKIPVGCVTRWWSWWGMLSVCLEHQSSLVSTIEIANDHQGGPGIIITNDDWKNAKEMVRMLEPFYEAVHALEGDNITLPLLPCVMSNLNSHIEMEGTAFKALDSHGAGGDDSAPLGRGDRWDDVPDVAKIATALSARTKGLEWLDESEKKVWRQAVLRKCRQLIGKDIAKEAATRSQEEPDVSVAKDSSVNPQVGRADEEPPTKKRKSFFTRCIQRAKASGSGGGGSGVGGAEGGGAGSQRGQDRPAASNSANSFALSVAGRMLVVEQELDLFVAEKGLDVDDTGENELNWWCQNQFAFPTLARLAAMYLAIPASSAASERVVSTSGNIVTKKRNSLGDDAVDALIFLEGSHGLAWSSELSEKELGTAEG